MEETILGKEVKFMIRPEGETEWKKITCCEVYEWMNEPQKKKTLNLIKRLAARAIIYAALHD